MMRLLPVLVLWATSAAAQESERQIDWRPDWEQAFREAAEKGLPVMVCINSKDGEPASERAAKETYRDAEFVALSRRFVMLVVSTHDHWPKGACPRFGGITCEEHRTCFKELRARYAEQFVVPGSGGEMISPQHAWFKSDGTLLRRKEYELTRAELMQRMRDVLAEVEGRAPETPGEPRPDAPPVEDPRQAPLSERDRSELERVRTGDRESRRAALGNLLATEKIAAHEALLEMLRAEKDQELRCDLLRAFGRARVVEARSFIEDHLNDRHDLVRSFAAVALEELALAESVPALIKRARRERDWMARKNMVRALGACGGPAADKEAAQALLKTLGSDKQNAVRKHAALALRGYEGEASKLVLKKLERAAARAKDPQVRGGIIFTLAYIGNTETTLPIFEEILEETNIDYVKSFMRAAIRVLRRQSGDFGRSAWYLFREDRDDPARDAPE